MNDPMGKLYRTVTWTALVVLTLAAAVMLIGDVLRNFQVVCSGMTVWLIAGMTFLGRRSIINPKIVQSIRQSGYEAGYDAGYADGHEVGYGKGREFPRPVLLSQSAGGARPKAFPLDRAAQ